jgi:hypothetical protein
MINTTMDTHLRGFEKLLGGSDLASVSLCTLGAEAGVLDAAIWRA